MKAAQGKKVFIIPIHSFVDIITNSSTELFIVDRNKIEENLKEIFDFIVECNEIDYETVVKKFDDYYDENPYILPEDIEDTSSLYVMDISYHNEFLNKMVEKYFHPLELEYKED